LVTPEGTVKVPLPVKTWQLENPPAAAAIVILPAPLVMVTFEPAVKVAAVVFVPLPIGIAPLATLVITGIVPLDA
jgi:hypothetical protein